MSDRFTLEFEGMQVRFVWIEGKLYGSTLDALEGGGFQNPSSTLSRYKAEHPEFEADMRRAELEPHPRRSTKGQHVLPISNLADLLMDISFGARHRARLHRCREWLLTAKPPQGIVTDRGQRFTRPEPEPVEAPASIPALSAAPAPILAAPAPAPVVHLEEAARNLAKAEALRQADPEISALYAGLAKAHLRKDEERAAATMRAQPIDPGHPMFAAGDVMVHFKGQIRHVNDVKEIAKRAGVVRDDLNGVEGLSVSTAPVINGRERPGWMLYTLRGMERIGEYLRQQGTNGATATDGN